MNLESKKGVFANLESIKGASASLKSKELYKSKSESLLSDHFYRITNLQHKRGLGRYIQSSTCT